MRQSLIWMAAFSLMLATGSAVGADEAYSRCQQWAQEDKVAADEMEDYMAQCLEEQRVAGVATDQDYSDDKSNDDKSSSSD